MKDRTFNRKGNYEKPYYVDSHRKLIEREVTYLSCDPQSKIKEFSFLSCENEDDEDDEEVDVHIKFLDDLTFEEASLDRNIDEFEASLNRKIDEFKVLLPYALLEIMDLDFRGIMFRTRKKALLRDLFKCIHRFTPLDILTKTEVKNSLKITKKGINKNLDISFILDLLKSKGFESALALAKYSDKNMFQLGEYCLQHYPDNMQMAADCFYEIKKNSPHFELANQLLLDILIQSEECVHNGDERIERLEKLFYYARNSGDVYRGLASQYYHELCGYSDLKPKIEYIKGDFNTLILLAAQMRELNSTNAKLQQEIQSIKSEAASQSVHEYSHMTKQKSSQSGAAKRGREDLDDNHDNSKASSLSRDMFFSENTERYNSSLPSQGDERLKKAKSELNELNSNNDENPTDVPLETYKPRFIG